jgi:hypothetical protein
MIAIGRAAKCAWEIGIRGGEMIGALMGGMTGILNGEMKGAAGDGMMVLTR